MEGPFFRNRRWYEQPDPIRRHFSHSPSVRGVPVHEVDPHRPGRPIQRSPERNSGPRIIRIPVQSFGSAKVDRSGSALKIQKVFRGFLVRKCLKKINDIKLQVDEIEEKLSRSEVVELVRRDDKERLRMNENLMSLLFKLDSICGVDFGVRVCRKAVIRKAIALQERIDAIVSNNSEEICEIVDDETEIRVSEEAGDSVEQECSSGNTGNMENSAANQENMEVEENDGEIKVIDVGVDCEVKVREPGSVNEHVDSVEESADCLKESLSEKDGKDNGADDNKRNRELLEKMVEDNEKMMNLMTQLCERNESQTKMINALTHRVELLEKAFVCDMMRKKKKKNKNNKAASDFTEDS